MELIEAQDGATTFAEAHVDGGPNLIQGVTLLGRVSKNGRRYSDRVMQDAVRLYDGVPFFLDHPTKRQMRDTDGHPAVAPPISSPHGHIVAGSRWWIQQS